MKQACCLGASTSHELLPGSVGSSCFPTPQELGCSHCYPLLAEGGAASSQAVGKVGGWFSYPGGVRSPPVFTAQQVCCRPKQITSRSTVTRSHSLAEYREAWQCVVPVDLQRHFRHGYQMVGNELILVHMLGLSFPQVLLLLLNTVSLQLLG